MYYCGPLQGAIHKVRYKGGENSKYISSKKPFPDVYVSYEIFTYKYTAEISLS